MRPESDAISRFVDCISTQSTVSDVAIVRKAMTTGALEPVIYVAPQMKSNLSPVRWEEIWDNEYARVPAPAEPTVHNGGWTSSYTHRQMPLDELSEWIDEAAARVTFLGPRRVLEVGCGVGMLAARVAPSCETYVGVDISEFALSYVKQNVARKLERCDFEAILLDARELSVLGARRFDTVVINSMAQYLSSAAEMVGVLDAAVAMLEPEGAIYVGDVLDLRLRRSAHLLAELARAEEEFPLDRVRELLAFRVATDIELALHPEFFIQYATERNLRTCLLLKHSQRVTEFTRFRYDVLLSRRSAHAPQRAQPGVAQSAAELRASIDSGHGCTITDLPNRKTRDPVAAETLLDRLHGTSRQLIRLVQATDRRDLDWIEQIVVSSGRTFEPLISLAGADLQHLACQSTDDADAAKHLYPYSDPDGSCDSARVANSPSLATNVFNLIPQLRGALPLDVREAVRGLRWVLVDRIPRNISGEPITCELPRPHQDGMSPPF